MIPREHGALATLIMPFLVGIGVAGQFVPEALLFLVSALGWFAARYPLGIALKALANRAAGYPSGQIRAAVPWLAGYAGVAAVAGLALLVVYDRWALLPLGILALAIMGVQTVLQRRHLDRAVWAELLAFGGLALTGPGAYYAATGSLDSLGFRVWLLTFLYAGASVFYDKMRVRQRIARSVAVHGAGTASGAIAPPFPARFFALDMLIYQTVLLAVLGLLVATGQMPWPGLVAFLPLTLKVVAAVHRNQPELSLRRLGLLELAHSATFTLLIVLAFHWR